jgi:hypothetical protein
MCSADGNRKGEELMRVSFVTATGADDKTDINKMEALSRDYPIEWGILLSKRLQGFPRFPSSSWIEKLCEKSLDCAGHLCGGYVNDLLVGMPPWELPDRSIYAGVRMTTMFQRYQINFHGIDYALDKSRMIDALRDMPIGPHDRKPTLIVQMDGVNDSRLYDVQEAGFYADPLFDKSHGEGTLPDEWPAPIRDDCDTHKFSGYAGGLSPDNLSEQLKKIADVVGDGFIWIDAETHLRNSDDQFDLSIVKKFAQAAERYF